MDSFKLNKIAGAVLGACLFAMGLKLAGEAIYQPGPPAKPGYPLPKETAEKAPAAGESPAATPIAVRLASADPKRGEADVKVCSACHNFQEGAGTKVGPDLYGVVDRPKGHVEGFDYSAGMKSKGGDWTYADLDQFLLKPSAYVQGTKMGYAGEDNPEKRADIISYLRTLAKDPAPLPKVTDEDKKVASKEEGKPGQKEAKAEAADTGKAAGEAEGQADFLKLVGTSDPKKGQAVAQVCQACHNVTKGSGTLVGPTLWNVVDRKKGSVEGYDYSAGLKNKGGDWSVNDLNSWLTNPQSYIPGTKMGYPGEANVKKRAEIIAYLRTLSDHPIALPGAAEGEAKAKDHSAAEANMSPAAKPGDQKPPAPPLKPDAAQPVPKSPEATNAPDGPRTPDEARPGMPQPAPTPDEPHGGKADAGKADTGKPDAGKADAGKPAGEQHSEAPASSQQAAVTPAAAPAGPAADAATMAPAPGDAGPVPYQAADPIAAPSEPPSQQLAKESGAAPSLTSAADDKPGDAATDKGPAPYSAPTPGEAQ